MLVSHMIVHGRLRNHRRVTKLVSELVTEHGISASFTEYRGHAQEIARTLPTDATAIMVVGGDGTLHDVVNGLMQRPEHERPAIHLVPLGTGNDVARALRARGQQASTWDVLRVDYRDLAGKPAHRYCINVADIGLGGEVTRHYDGTLRRFPFGMGYMVAGFKGLQTAQRSRATITVDDEVIETTILSVCLCNSSWFGSGIGINPMADPTDGLIDVTIIGDISAGTYLRFLPQLRAGKAIRHPQLRYHRGTAITIATHDPLPVEIDGEYVGTGPVVVTLKPKAVMFYKPITG